jgi:hypothetical protein
MPTKTPVANPLSAIKLLLVQFFFFSSIDFFLLCVGFVLFYEACMLKEMAAPISGISAS